MSSVAASIRLLIRRPPPARVFPRSTRPAVEGGGSECLGYRYHSVAIVDDGSPPPESLDPIRVYEPSTRPVDIAARAA